MRGFDLSIRRPFDNRRVRKCVSSRLFAVAGIILLWVLCIIACLHAKCIVAARRRETLNLQVIDSLATNYYFGDVNLPFIFFGVPMNTNAVHFNPSAIAQSSVLSQTLWIVAFAAATAIGARVEIPLYPVPFTLQTMFVLLAGAFLGARNGAISQLVYLAIGVLGAPVFSSGGGLGLMKLLGPTGGYLLAFPVAAALVGYLTQQFKNYPAIVVSMFAGLLVIFVSGTLHLNAFYIHDFSTAFTSGFLIFSWWDVLKLFAAATIYFEIAERWPRLG